MGGNKNLKEREKTGKKRAKQLRLDFFKKTSKDDCVDGCHETDDGESVYIGMRDLVRAPIIERSDLTR